MTLMWYQRNQFKHNFKKRVVGSYIYFNKWVILDPKLIIFSTLIILYYYFCQFSHLLSYLWCQLIILQRKYSFKALTHAAFSPNHILAANTTLHILDLHIFLCIFLICLDRNSIKIGLAEVLESPFSVCKKCFWKKINRYLIKFRKYF